MYDLELIKSTLKTKLKALTDPYDTSTTPKTVLQNVIRGEPDKIGLFNGTLGVLLFSDANEKMLGLSKRGQLGTPRRQIWQITVDGAIVLFVPRNDDAADSVATHLTDVVSDFFKDNNALELPATSVTTPQNQSMAWRPIDVVLENTKKPKKCLTAAIKFTITANDNKKG